MIPTSESGGNLSDVTHHHPDTSPEATSTYDRTKHHQTGPDRQRGGLPASRRTKKINSGRNFDAPKRAPNLQARNRHAICVRAARGAARARDLSFLSTGVYTLEIHIITTTKMHPARRCRGCMAVGRPRRPAARGARARAVGERGGHTHIESTDATERRQTRVPRETRRASTN